MPFEKGHKFAKGGKREGAGRQPDWFRKRCAEIVEKKKLVEFIGRVAAGEEVESKLSKDGDVVELPVSIHDRLYASEMLFDRGFGKPIATAADEGWKGPLQAVINDTQLLKLIYALNHTDGHGKGSGDSGVVAGGAAPLQART